MLKFQMSHSTKIKDGKVGPSKVNTWKVLTKELDLKETNALN